MKFGLKLDGEFSFNVIHPTSNRDVFKAITDTISNESIKLSRVRQNALKSYLNTLENDELFVDPCREPMTLSFGFEL